MEGRKHPVPRQKVQGVEREVDAGLGKRQEFFLLHVPGLPGLALIRSASFQT